MICPIDLVQMHQKDKVGGGESTDEIYKTWELKECPSCHRLVLEFYAAKVVTTLKEANQIAKGELPL